MDETFFTYLHDYFMSFIFVTTLGMTECLNCNFFKKNVYSETEMFLFRISKLVILCIFMITEVLLSEPNSFSFSEVMLKGLNRLPWERVDVSFKKSRQRFFAHSTIQVCHLFYICTCHSLIHLS